MAPPGEGTGTIDSVTGRGGIHSLEKKKAAVLNSDSIFLGPQFSMNLRESTVNVALLYVIHPQF